MYKLIGLEILALEKDYKETLKKISQYQKILKSRNNMDQVFKEDLQALKQNLPLPGGL